MFHHLVSDPQVSTKYGDFEQNYMFFIFILKKVEKKCGVLQIGFTWNWLSTVDFPVPQLKYQTFQKGG